MKEDVFLRLPQILGDKKSNPQIEPIIPISKTTWWNWVQSGKAPKPLKLSKGVTVWRSTEIANFVTELSASEV